MDPRNLIRWRNRQQQQQEEMQNSLWWASQVILWTSFWPPVGGWSIPRRGLSITWSEETRSASQIQVIWHLLPKTASHLVHLNQYPLSPSGLCSGAVTETA